MEAWSLEPGRGQAGRSSARAALRAKAWLCAECGPRRAVATKAFAGRPVVAATKVAGAARCLAAAVVAETAFTEAALRRCVAETTLRGCVTEAALRTTCVTETAVGMTFVSVAAMRP